MKKSFKTEIDPSEDQRIKIHQTIGVCRYVYNLYLDQSKKRYEAGGSFLSGKSFSVWMNREYLPNNPDKQWIKKVNSKAVKKSLENAHIAFRRFFRGQSGYPQFKKKGKTDPAMYFVKNNPKDCFCERHRIKIPTLGWVRLKEKGYLPTTKSGYSIISGTISMKAGRYFVSAVVEMPEPKIEQSTNKGIGIDLGVKDLAIVSDGRIYPNINKTRRVRKLEKRLRREQRRLSRKQENKKKGGATQGRNLQKQRLKVQQLYATLTNIRTDYLNKVVSEVVKIKPSYITMEDLNVSGMRKNRHLSKAISDQKLAEFREKLTAKGKASGIEIRVVSRWYPSSKRCNHCGHIKKDLKLSDRVYRCECGYVEDRDRNAAYNLRDAETYLLA